jgi:hypothetical protein
VIQDCLTVEAQLAGDLGGGLLFEEIEAEDRLALAGQLFDLVEDTLEDGGFDPLCFMVVVSLGAQVGDFAMAFALAGAKAEIVDGFVADDDIEPAFDVFHRPHPGSGVVQFGEGVGDNIFRVLLKLRCFLYPLSMAMALMESSDSMSRWAARSIRWRMM